MSVILINLQGLDDNMSISKIIDLLSLYREREFPMAFNTESNDIAIGYNQWYDSWFILNEESGTELVLEDNTLCLNYCCGYCGFSSTSLEEYLDHVTANPDHYEAGHRISYKDMYFHRTPDDGTVNELVDVFSKYKDRLILLCKKLLRENLNNSYLCESILDIYGIDCEEFVEKVKTTLRETGSKTLLI